MLPRCSFHIFEELTNPADAQAEIALRENSSTIREETREPTRDRRTVRDQNWTMVPQLPLGLLGDDNLCLLSVSDSESLFGKNLKITVLILKMSDIFSFIFLEKLTCIFA